MPLDPVTIHRENQARQAVEAIPSYVPAQRYLDKLEKTGALLPGAASAVLDRVLGRVGGRPATRSGNFVEHLVNAVEFLESDRGRGFRNQLYKPDETEQPLVRELRNFGYSKEDAEKMFRSDAVKFAPYAPGQELVRALARHIAAVDPMRLGATRTDNRPLLAEKTPTAPPTAPQWQPGQNGGTLINGVFYANPPAPDQAPPPQGPKEKHLESVRLGF